MPRMLAVLLLSAVASTLAAQQQETSYGSLWLCPAAFEMNAGGAPYALEVYVPSVPAVKVRSDGGIYAGVFAGNLAPGSLTFPGTSIDLDTTSAFPIGEGAFDPVSGMLVVPGVPLPAAFSGVTLAVQALILVPSHPGGFATTPATNLTFVAGHGGRLTLGDDSYAQFNFHTPFPFPSTAPHYTRTYVNSNGNLTFGVGSWDYTPTVAEFLVGPPRIAPFWNDLNPGVGGDVIAVERGGRTVVSWLDVPEYWIGGANTGTIVLDHATGAVSFSYPANGVSFQTGIVGVSPGNLASPFPPSIDLSSSGGVTGGALYELFTASNPFDLQGHELTFTPIVAAAQGFVLAVAGPNGPQWPPPSVTITGPNQVSHDGQFPPGAAPIFNAVIAGGCPPFTFEWSVFHAGGGEEPSEPVNGPGPANAKSIHFFEDAVGHIEVVIVRVTDSLNRHATKGKSVLVVP